MERPLDSSPLSNPFFSAEDRNWVKTVERRYEIEDRLLDAIRRGDTETARWLQRERLDGIGNFDYLGGDPLEMAQRWCRIMNVSGRIAARRGGLPALYLHNISEKFGLIITRTRDMRALKEELPMRIVTEYAEAVAHLSTHGYGKVVNAAVRYISYHITETISLQAMAEELFVSEGYLARRFHRETGCTISDYTNRMRVDMAKLLLEQGDLDITEIALRVGFRDGSYFSKVFRRFTGQTPRGYQTCARPHPTF